MGLGGSGAPPKWDGGGGGDGGRGQSWMGLPWPCGWKGLVPGGGGGGVSGTSLGIRGKGGGLLPPSLSLSHPCPLMQPNGYKGHSWCSWALAMGKLRQGGAQCPALAPALSLATATAPGGAQDTPPDHRVLPELRVSSETGAVFVHELKRELFLEAFVTRSEDDGATPITFHAHLRDHPDLPLWLRYTQRDPHQPGYLYGCPTATEVGPHTIEVLAYNRLTYETAAQSLLITIIPAPRGHPPFQGEFLVGNRNVEELLPVAARDMFLQATEGVWEQGDLQVINVTSALDRGGRVPLPIEGRREGYEQHPQTPGSMRGYGAELQPPHRVYVSGVSQTPSSMGGYGAELQPPHRVYVSGVPQTPGSMRGYGADLQPPHRVYVSVGSHGPFSGCLTSASSSRSRFLCSLGQQPLASCYDTFAPHFSIQWCNLTLLQVQPSPTEPGPVWGSGVLEEGGGFQPPTEEPPPDLLPQFLLTLLVPLVVAALLCLFLGHLMCCRREGVQKRDLETSDIQLFHHTTIHGDTQELRLMAGSRDVPQPLSTLPMFNVRTGQRINPMAAAADGARVPLLPQ
uniref:Uncharacterized protein n=1 Tax=Melopsittacus undulatus TaxID=13146 RepID=A0A8V5GVZ7_MELUD